MNPVNVTTGPYWPEPIRLVSLANSAYGFVTVEACGLETGRHYTTTLPVDHWDALCLPRELAPTFQAAPAEFKLALEAQRLKLAYSCDPLLAANNSRVELLPHQVEAVYTVMLPQPTIRHLMAHDAGAGKTVMAGLLYKELRLRQPNLRTLVVAPAALTVQWQRELDEKFLEHFDIVGRDELRANASVWVQSSRLITSVDFARQPDVQASLANVSWDLVIVDEAHHLAGYDTHTTLAYRLGEVLSRQSRHLILATATPHKGDPENFLKLLQLLDPGIHSPSIVRRAPAGQRGSPLMLRRLKEEMVGFDGEPLFKPRVVETRWHCVADNPPEMALYSALTEYVHKTYRAAERIGGKEKVNVQFAMTMLQRRMGSSFAALEKSLRRRRDNLLQPAADSAPTTTPEHLEDLTEAERWEVEKRAELATLAKTRQERGKEAAQVEALLDKLNAVRQSRIETKVVALQKILAEAGVAPGNGEKLLVFTEFKDTLDFLRKLFEGWGYTVTEIDGGMGHDLRRKAEREFSERVQVMVATEAAGEGINLQFCARMVNYDLPWVPTRIEQRMGRIHRYGQKRVAKVYNLTAADTREGKVLVGLMDRLDAMRVHLGDQVFDVVSTLVSDVDMEKLLANVALAPPTEASQEEALRKLIQATEAGAERYQKWEEHPFAVQPEQFLEMQAASRESRLTPEYAQHFFVDTLEQLKEKSVSASGDNRASPGDAEVLQVKLTRPTVARALHVDVERSLRLSFRGEVCKEHSNVEFVALGTPTMDGTLRLAQTSWGHLLPEGSLFIDPELAPGEAYLLWFLSGRVFDGNARLVEAALFGVRQTPESMVSAPASALIDLVPGSEGLPVPQVLLGLARDPRPVITWSTQYQQLPFLDVVRGRRAAITALRIGSVLEDAEAALVAKQQAYDASVFGGDGDIAETEQALEAAKRRLAEQRAGFEREAACSLGAPYIVGVAAVIPSAAEPTDDLSDLRPEIAAAAEEKARGYEEARGCSVVNVSGEHRQYPYDLHSKGPGGVRCIEVKGTTTGRITLSENERRTAKRLGPSYYLYIVRDPLGAGHLSIIRDPLAKMRHDGTLYSGVRYVYDANTWQTSVDEETPL